MAGRFPRAKNVGELWRNLRDGVESVRFFSDAELLESGVDPSLNTYRLLGAGFLGSFTTFSTWMVETVFLAAGGSGRDLGRALGWLLGMAALGIAAGVPMAWWFARHIRRLIDEAEASHER